MKIQEFYPRIAYKKISLKIHAKTFEARTEHGEIFATCDVVDLSAARALANLALDKGCEVRHDYSVDSTDRFTSWESP